MEHPHRFHFLGGQFVLLEEDSGGRDKTLMMSDDERCGAALSKKVCHC